MVPLNIHPKVSAERLSYPTQPQAVGPFCSPRPRLFLVRLAGLAIDDISTRSTHLRRFCPSTSLGDAEAARREASGPIFHLAVCMWPGLIPQGKNGRVRWQCGRLARASRFVVRVLVIYKPKRRGLRSESSVGVHFYFAMLEPTIAGATSLQAASAPGRTYF